MRNERVLPVLIIAGFTFCAQRMAIADDFNRDDSVLILVSGPAAQSTPWGLSGKASLYRGTATAVSGKIIFTAVSSAKDVSCERRSAKKVSQPFDYSSQGQIPPGVYFVSYFRLDPNGDRHRLAIADSKQGTTIDVQVEGKKVTRTGIQFHQAINDLAEYSPSLSEGCMIFSKGNFEQLFGTEFLAPNTSPLHYVVKNNPNAAGYVGRGRVITFVTDVTNADLQGRQLDMFKKICEGHEIGLSQASFATGSSDITQTRLRWTNP